MSLFPSDDAGRKALPIFAMIVGYFPNALREVTRVCVANNVRYSPDRAPTDIVWNRGKSQDQFGSLFRHMLERKVDGHVFETVSEEVAKVIGRPNVYVLAEAAWRALAMLEEEIEQQEKHDADVLREDALGIGEPLTATILKDFNKSYGGPLFPTWSSVKPKCPVCGFSEHVFHAPGGGFGCLMGHGVHFFKADVDPT